MFLSIVFAFRQENMVKLYLDVLIKKYKYQIMHTK